MPMSFSWKGSFTTLADFTQIPVLIYDIVMVLHAKAILHHALAQQLLQSDFDGSLTAAGQQLLAAAGIMEYLGATLLPQWLVSTSTAIRPLETSEHACSALADIYQAEAQQMAITKALSKDGGTPPGVLVKLCIAYIRSLDQGIDKFLKGPGDSRVSVDSYLLAFNREFIAALIYFFSGESYRAKEDAGIAVGYYNESKVRTTHLLILQPNRGLEY
jgi:hypothetical protein